MDNANAGGDRGDFAEGQGVFGTPESFEKAFETTGHKEANRGIGEAAASEALREVFGEQEVGDEKNFESPNVLEGAQAPETTLTSEMKLANEITLAPEIKPLIADGKTEKKLGKIGVSLVGEKVDAEGVSAEVKKIKALPLYEQSAARDEASAKMIYANFGRMVGNDDIGEIQAEEQRRAA